MNDVREAMRTQQRILTENDNKRIVPNNVERRLLHSRYSARTFASFSLPQTIVLGKK